MNAVLALSTVMTVLEKLVELEPEIVQGFTDLKGFATALYTQLSGTPISDTDLVTLEAKIDDLHSQLQEPLED